MTHRRERSGFTLIELLVTIAIVAVLLSLVLPIAGKTVRSARGFKCQMSQRSVAYDFVVFADEQLHGSRGNDEADAGRRGQFRLETFVESQYGVDEFWAWPGETTHQLPDRDRNDPLRCPEVTGQLTLRSNAPCTGGAVSPQETVSYGFNARLYVAERPGGVATVWLRGSIAGETNVPLLLDVDGAAAADSGYSDVPFFAAPALDSPVVFAAGRYWYPAMRHNGAMNVAFVDGHVASSRVPLAEPTWRWDFVPAH